MKTRHLAFLLLVVLIGLAASFFSGNPATNAEQPQQQPTDRPAFAPDRVIVKLRPATPTVSSLDRSSTDKAVLTGLLGPNVVKKSTPLFVAELAPADPGAAASAKGAGLSRIYRLDLEAGRDVLQAVAALSADSIVEYAEPDYYAGRAEAPNDPRYGGQ